MCRMNLNSALWSVTLHLVYSRRANRTQKIDFRDTYSVRGTAGWHKELPQTHSTEATTPKRAFKTELTLEL